MHIYGSGCQQLDSGHGLHEIRSLGLIHFEVSGVALQELRQTCSHVTPPVLVCAVQVQDITSK